MKIFNVDKDNFDEYSEVIKDIKEEYCDAFDFSYEHCEEHFCSTCPLSKKLNKWKKILS